MKYIIDGSFLCGHIKGVQRYARQITNELDKYYIGWKIWKNVGTVHVSEICGQAEG